MEQIINGCNDFTEKKQNIIDAHAHIFPLKIAQKAVKSIGDFYNIPMDSSGGTAEDLIKSGNRAGISKFVISSTATEKHQVRAINNFIAEAVKQYSCFTGLITLHPDLTVKEAECEINFALNNGLKGIKMHPDFQKFAIDDKKMFGIYGVAEGILPILFHTGDKRYSYSNPQRLAYTAKMFKRLKCVGAHFGGYSEWESIDCYTDTENVFFDTCSSLPFFSAEKATEIIQKLGAHRFMFGTDFPMWEHNTELERFKKLKLNDDQTEKILYNNAKAFYGIE